MQTNLTTYSDSELLIIHFSNSAFHYVLTEQTGLDIMLANWTINNCYPTTILTIGVRDIVVNSYVQTVLLGMTKEVDREINIRTLNTGSAEYYHYNGIGPRDSITKQ